MTDFTRNLRTTLLAKDILTEQETALLDLTKGRQTRRKKRVLARLQRHAEAEAGGDPLLIDWSAINWEKWLRIIGILVSILFLFLAEEPE